MQVANEFAVLTAVWRYHSHIRVAQLQESNIAISGMDVLRLGISVTINGLTGSVMERVRPSSTLLVRVLGQIHQAAAQESFPYLLACPAGPHHLTLSAHTPGLGKIVFCRLCTCDHVATDGSRAVCSLHAD